MWQIVLGTWHGLSQFMLIIPLWRRYYQYPHLREEEVDIWWDNLGRGEANILTQVADERTLCLFTIILWSRIYYSPGTWVRRPFESDWRSRGTESSELREVMYLLRKRVTWGFSGHVEYSRTKHLTGIYWAWVFCFFFFLNYKRAKSFKKLNFFDMEYALF